LEPCYFSSSNFTSNPCIYVSINLGSVHVYVFKTLIRGIQHPRRHRDIQVKPTPPLMIFLSISVCPFLCMHLSLSLSDCLNVSVSDCLNVSLSDCPNVSLPDCKCFSIRLNVSICFSLYLFVNYTNKISSRTTDYCPKDF